jgi:tRNA-dihydrouridine synthase A
MSITAKTYPEISVAPMMDWTNRHCRYFHRLLSPNALLYTEMVTTGALIHGDAPRFLRFDESEHPVALQLGGSDPKDLAVAAKMGASEGYDEINLNCGCPSDRVQNGRFGACLMKEPAHVADCIEAMIDAVDIPVTVKCRIGIDEQDDFAFLDEFVDKIADKWCKTFVIHARKAWLSGLSPKQNREVPPLNYERAHEIKAKYPHLRIILNGGLQTVESVQEHMKGLDGAMIGREAYSNPYILTAFEEHIFDNHAIISREDAALAMMNYAKAQKEAFDVPVKSITRHILGLYAHQKGAKAWKRALSTLPYETSADEHVIEQALEAVARATDWQ